MEEWKCPDGHPENPDDDDGAPSTVLVVDDSRVIRAYLRSRLLQAGYKVFLARDGAEAIGLLYDDIGIVLLDLWMPGMDGMACLRHIRENYPDISVIMLTVSHEISHAVEAMKHGAYDFVTKPFNPDALLILVKQAMRSRHQAYRLRRSESELQKAREHEASIAAKIQQTLLLGDHSKVFPGVRIGDLTVASKNVDGDFYDFYRLNDQCFDIIIGDVMGKGVAAALLGAAAKHRFMSVLYHLVTRHEKGPLPSPEEIVGMAHEDMIAKMMDLETFFTLCYARFDLSRNVVSYVDCGHMRTIHLNGATGDCSLLQGVNMPLGFPGQQRFTQSQAPFSPGDLFFFYSDGLTEAKNPRQEFYGEERLAAFIQRHRHLDPQVLCRKAWNEIMEFTGSDSVFDDFTCVAVKVDELDAACALQEWNLDVRSDLGELERVRGFIGDICCRLGSRMPDEERIRMIQTAATEIMSNIITHAYGHNPGMGIAIKANAGDEELVLRFYDQGAPFDPDQAPDQPLKEAREDGLGLHIVKNIADSVRYTRDEGGMNCSCATFSLQRREAW